MPYLPDPAALETAFPKVNTRDMVFQIRLIEEQYRRMYPLISYSCIKVAINPTTITPNGDRSPVGAPGTTKFDPVWNEAVDSSLTSWKQPHATPGTVLSTEVEQFTTPLQINARVQRISRETELKKYGFDKVRDLTLFIPLTLLDRKGIKVKHGDKFNWSGSEYTVLDFNTNGYWKNTDVAMYMVLNCEHRRKGA